jgi:hypothetical protein
MDNVFSYPDLFDNIHTKAINCCGTVRPNRKGMPSDFGRKLRLKRGDIKTKVKGDLTAVIWKDKRNVNILTNMHRPPAEGNLCDEYGNTLKPAIVQDYNRQMGYVDKSDHMTNRYSISRHTWKWKKKLFFQRACDVTVGKFDKCLHFISIFIAQKLIVVLITRYVLQNNIQTVPLNPTPSPRLELRAVSGLLP